MKELDQKATKVVTYRPEEVMKMQPSELVEGENWFHPLVEKKFYGWEVLTSLHEWSTDLVYVILTKVPKNKR